MPIRFAGAREPRELERRVLGLQNAVQIQAF